MSIEKAFAIHGTPGDIWDALWLEVATGEIAHDTVHASNRPHMLAVNVMLGDVAARLTYKIEAAEDHTEVAVTLEPLSSRYRLYQILTFGHLRRNYEILLVEGLSNLKRAVEDGPLAEPERGLTPDPP